MRIAPAAGGRGPWRRLGIPGAEQVEVVCRFFLPQAAFDSRPAMRATLETWREAGFLTVTPGDVVDDEAIIAQITEDSQRFNIRTLAYHRGMLEGSSPGSRGKGSSA